MDKTDLKVLGVLNENAKASYSSIGREVHLSPSAVFERLKRLEEEGVIKRYVTQIDLKKLGINVLALIECKVHSAKEREFSSQILTLDEVIKIYKVTGVSSYVIEVGTTTDEALTTLTESLQYLSDTEIRKIVSVHPKDILLQIESVEGH